MARLLRMPDVASDDDEGVLSSWLVGERDLFDAAQTIAYVETSTMLLSVEAGRPGVLLRTLVGPGTQVDAGTPIGVIGEPDERNLDLDTLLAGLGLNGTAERHPMFDPPPPSVLAEPEPDQAPDPEPESAPEREPDQAPDPAPESAPEREPDQAPDPAPPRHASGPKPSFFTPELAIPVFDAGPAALALTQPEPQPAPLPNPAPDPAPDAPPEPAPRLSGLTHDHLRASIRAERLLAVVAEIGGAEAGATVDLLVVKAVGAVHRQLPDMNLTTGGDGARRETSVDVGLTVGTEEGFVAPVVRNVGLLTLEALVVRAHDLVVRARTDRLEPSETEGGSIVVTNLGKYGIDESVGIVAPPQVAVLALGGVRDDAVVEGGVVVAGKVLTLTLSVDHEHVDDALAARWLGVLAALLERPEWMQG